MNLPRIYAEQICPVCGYKLNFRPWADAQQEDRNCPSCGIVFGYDDQDEKQRDATYLAWRERWIDGGRRWWSKEPQPDDFNPPWQLARLEHLEKSPLKPE